VQFEQLRLAERLETWIVEALYAHPAEEYSCALLEAILSDMHKRLRQLPSAKSGKLAASAMILVQDPSEASVYHLASVGDQRLYQSHPGGSSVLLRSPQELGSLALSKAERLHQLGGALGQGTHIDIRCAQLNLHQNESWGILSHGLHEHLSAPHLGAINNHPLHPGQGWKSTLEEHVPTSEHLLRVYTLGSCAILGQDAKRAEICTLYPKIQRSGNKWAAAGLAALALFGISASPLHADEDAIDWGIAVSALDKTADTGKLIAYAQDLQREEQAAEIDLLKYQLQAALDTGDKHAYRKLSKQLLAMNAEVSFPERSNDAEASPDLDGKIQALKERAARLRAEQETAVALAGELERLQAEIRRRDALISELREHQTVLGQLIQEITHGQDLHTGSQQTEALSTHLNQLRDKEELIDNLNSARNSLLEELATSRNHIEDLEGSLQSAEKSKTALETQLAALREQSKQVTLDKTEELEEQKLRYQQEIGTLRNTLSTAQEQLALTEAELGAKEGEIQELSLIREGLSAELQYAQEKLRLVEQGLLSVEQVEGKLGQTDEHLHRLHQDHNELAQSFSQSEENLLGKLAELTQENQELKQSLSSLNERLAAQESLPIARVLEHFDTLAEKVSAIDGIQSHLAVLENAQEELKESGRQVQELHAAQTEIQSQLSEGLAQVNALREALSGVQNRMGSLDQQQAQIDAAEETLASLQELSPAVEQQLNVFNHRLIDVEENQLFITDLADVADHYARLEGKIDGVQEHLSALQDASEQDRSQLAIQVAESQKGIEGLKNEILTAGEELQSFQELAQKHFVSAESEQERVSALEKELRQTTEGLSRFEEVDSLAQEITSFQAQTDERLASLENTQEYVSVLEKELRQTSEGLRRFEEVGRLAQEITKIQEHTESRFASVDQKLGQLNDLEQEMQHAEAELARLEQIDSLSGDLTALQMLTQEHFSTLRAQFEASQAENKSEQATLAEKLQETQDIIALLEETSASKLVRIEEGLQDSKSKMETELVKQAHASEQLLAQWKEEAEHALAESGQTWKDAHSRLQAELEGLGAETTQLLSSLQESVTAQNGEIQELASSQDQTALQLAEQVRSTQAQLNQWKDESAEHLVAQTADAQKHIEGLQAQTEELIQGLRQTLLTQQENIDSLVDAQAHQDTALAHNAEALSLWKNESQDALASLRSEQLAQAESFDELALSTSKGLQTLESTQQEALLASQVELQELQAKQFSHFNELLSAQTQGLETLREELEQNSSVRLEQLAQHSESLFQELQAALTSAQQELQQLEGHGKHIASLEAEQESFAKHAETLDRLAQSIETLQEARKQDLAFIEEQLAAATEPLIQEAGDQSRSLDVIRERVVDLGHWRDADMERLNSELAALKEGSETSSQGLELLKHKEMARDEALASLGDRLSGLERSEESHYLELEKTLQKQRQTQGIFDSQLAKLEDLPEKLADAEKTLEGLAFERSRSAQGISQLNERVQSLQGDLASLSYLEKDMAETLETLGALKGHAEVIGRLEAQLSSREAEIQELERQHQFTESRLHSTQDSIATLERQLEKVDGLAFDLRDQQAKVNELDQSQEALALDLNQGTQRFQSLKQRMDKLSEVEGRLRAREQMLTDLNRSHGTVESLLRATQTKVALLQKEVERSRDLRESLRENDGIVKSVSSAHDNLIVEVTTTKRKLTAMERRLNLLAEIEDKLREKDAVISNLNLSQRAMQERLEASQNKLSYLEKQLSALDKLDRQVSSLQKQVSSAR
jgi:chromosome segregation ATPase